MLVIHIYSASLCSFKECGGSKFRYINLYTPFRKKLNVSQVFIYDHDDRCTEF